MDATPQQRQFAVEYLIDFNGTNAARRMGITESYCSGFAFRMLSHSKVIELIDEIQSEHAAKAGLSCEWVLRQWKQIAEADPNELIYVKLESCHHCYGVGHEYQWSEFEYQQACNNAAMHRCSKNCEAICGLRVPPPNPGGFGYDPNRAPAENCPVCHGEGYERVCAADSRRLKGSARRLYAGVKKTKDGIQVLMRDQDAALMNIAKYLGMVIDKKEVAGANGQPLVPYANVTADDFTSDQLAQIIAQCEAEEVAAALSVA